MTSGKKLSTKRSVLKVLVEKKLWWKLEKTSELNFHWECLHLQYLAIHTFLYQIVFIVLIYHLFHKHKLDQISMKKAGILLREPQLQWILKGQNLLQNLLIHTIPLFHYNLAVEEIHPTLMFLVELCLDNERI